MIAKGILNEHVPIADVPLSMIVMESCGATIFWERGDSRMGGLLIMSSGVQR